MSLDPSAGPFSAVLYYTRTTLEAVLHGIIAQPLLGVARRVIRRRLAGYKVRVNYIDTLLPERVAGAPRVAVVGGGLAGIAAASTLARRGFSVTLYERNTHLGGKLGAWEHTFEDGSTAAVEHGFHAFFGSYYNLLRFLDRLGVRGSFKRAEDYRILLGDGDEMGFTDVEPTPFLNLFHIVWLGIFDWKEFVVAPQQRLLQVLAGYEHDATYHELDGISFEAFARRQRLPERMKLMFNTFSRAFFARADQMSMAALLRSFHLFYLSNDHGLLYEYPDDDHATTLLKPMADHLAALGVEVRLGTPVQALERADGNALRVDGERFDHVVLAADSRPARELLRRSPIEREAPGLVDNLTAIRPINRYAVWRLWLDKDYRAELPFFTVTERRKALDSLCTYHRFERQSVAWAAEHGGSVIELHSYQVPDELKDAEAVKAALLDDMVHFLPELRGYTIRREFFQLKDDFSSFHVGMEGSRPATTTDVDGLVLAGDWVRLPVPAMLMEGAFTSGLYAANAILGEHGLREEPIYSVPLRGVALGNE
jgi:isorenieratene synthase